MSRFPGQFVLLWFAVLGLLTQGLGPGLRTGELLLCVGCDDTGWAVLAPEAESPTDNCCAHAPSERPSPPIPGQSIGQGDECGCVSVPLGGGAASFVSGAAPLTPVALSPVTTIAGLANPEPRVSPPPALRAPPWSSAPLARCTVLVL